MLCLGGATERDFARPIAVRMGKIQNHFQAAAQLCCRLGFRIPNGRQDAKYCRGVDISDGHETDMWANVGCKRIRPLLDVLRPTPGSGMRLEISRHAIVEGDCLFGSLPFTQRGPYGAFVGDWVNALRQLLARISGLFSGLCEAYHWEWA